METEQSPQRDLVVALTGASGAIYAVRLLELLLAAGRTVHITISTAATIVLDRELGLKVDLKHFDQTQLLPPHDAFAADSLLRGWKSTTASNSAPRGKLHYYHHSDFMAGIASGSFRTGGMVICPCSMGTLASISTGQSSNLIQRAADVHLKERRKLILVPRETPLGTIQLENMKRLADAGAVVLPAMPGYYHQPKTIHDLIDFVVARILDHLGVEHQLFRRWGDTSQS
jgi:4-hydroxy-3-polyprenylbenzoate decarboxylase